MKQRTVKRFTDGLLDNDKILDALHISAGQTVVDAGCGYGYMTRLFSQRVGNSGQVYAIDKNVQFIQSVRDEIDDENTIAMVSDIAKPTSITQGSVDLVYISTVIHSMAPAHLEGMIQEVQRLCGSSGVLAVVEIAKHETPFGPPLKQRYSPEELQDAVPFTPLKTVPVADHFYMQTFQVHS